MAFPLPCPPPPVCTQTIFHVASHVCQRLSRSRAFIFILQRIFFISWFFCLFYYFENLIIHPSSHQRRLYPKNKSHIIFSFFARIFLGVSTNYLTLSLCSLNRARLFIESYDLPNTRWANNIFAVRFLLIAREWRMPNVYLKKYIAEWTIIVNESIGITEGFLFILKYKKRWMPHQEIYKKFFKHSKRKNRPWGGFLCTSWRP